MTGKLPNPQDSHVPSVVLAITAVSNMEDAQRLATLLVEQRLAACVNLVPGINSIYRWKGAVESAGEILLLIKTSIALLSDLERAVVANHSYEVPEFLVVPIHSGSQPYLQWVNENLR